MRVAIVGSRTWTDPLAVSCAIAALPYDTVVLTGGAPGADRMAAAAARRVCLQVVELRADWSRGRSAGPQRNAELVAQADRVIAFWDGRSPGTGDTIRKARAAGKPVVIVRPTAPTPQTALAL